MNIVVYLGSNEGTSPKFREAVIELGNWIGRSGNTLIYGGSESGLMGMLARSALEAGGRVIGIEPQFFIDKVYQLEGLTQLIATKDMKDRKAKMIEMGDAFIAFPGGLGTLDEISEIMCLNAIEQIDAPCIVYNLDGYYRHLIGLFEDMKTNGLASDRSLGLVKFADNLEDIKEILTMKYNFYGWDSAEVAPIDPKYANVKNQTHMYDLMKKVWSIESCAPRYRCEWSTENPTRGQCSITSFLVQDIFGGKVYGVPLSEGGFHCYNVVGDSVFDLTSEQFQGKEKLVFSKENEQFREEHFASEEKKARYELLKAGLEKVMNE